MQKINFQKYNSFIFDFDGVILDSNNIKRNALANAVEGILSKKKASEFVNYFISLNGVPREEKIAKFVPEEHYKYVLKRYEDIINVELKNAQLISGVRDFIHAIAQLKKNMIVLSGGTQTEVINLLKERELLENFDGVLGGPKNKEENLKGIKLEKPVLYFGDSKVDYLVSKKNNFDFVFVFGASNVENWEIKVKEWKVLKVIRDFANE